MANRAVAPCSSLNLIQEPTQKPPQKPPLDIRPAQITRVNETPASPAVEEQVVPGPSSIGVRSLASVMLLFTGIYGLIEELCLSRRAG